MLYDMTVFLNHSFPSLGVVGSSKANSNRKRRAEETTAFRSGEVKSTAVVMMMMMMIMVVMMMMIMVVMMSTMIIAIKIRNYVGIELSILNSSFFLTYLNLFTHTLSLTPTHLHTSDCCRDIRM